jgi:hypothetical protein
MTPDQFRAAVSALQWTYRGLAEMVQVDERQVRRWAAGATVPPHVAAWIEKAARELGPLQAKIAATNSEIAEWTRKNPPPPKKPVDVSA